MKNRQVLDDFISMHCFKAVIIGMEDILGKEGTASAMIAAGRKRGLAVAEQAGLKGKRPPVESLAGTLDGYLGEHGTCLCQVVNVQSTADGYYVTTRETICTAAEPPGSERVCTYTMGAILGFIESVYDVKLRGAHVANILKGSPTDDFALTLIS